jgi:hypothetical protein
MARKSASSLATPTPRVEIVSRPTPPADLPPESITLWHEITAGVPADYFTGTDLTLLKALTLAVHQKTLADAIVAAEGLILNGKPHPAAKLSIQLSTSIASLSGKLRLCQSSRSRPDSAGLKRAHTGGLRPWDVGHDT